MTEWRKVRSVTWARGNLVSVDWLRGELARCGFVAADQQTNEYLERCLRNLRLHGMFWEGQVRDFLDDERSRADLRALYEPAGSVLERETFGAKLDAFGYTWWGPMIHRAHPEVRPQMRQTVGEELQRSREKAELNEVRGW